MKFADRNSNTGFTEITWSDHVSACKSCRQVDFAASASFTKACALGSQLLQEEMKKRQAPVVRQKAAEVEKWAKDAGTFITHKSKLKNTRYVGDT